MKFVMQRLELQEKNSVLIVEEQRGLKVVVQSSEIKGQDGDVNLVLKMQKD